MAGTELPLFNSYCIDSCSIMDLWDEDVYPSASFPTLRPQVLQHISNGTISSCVEVYQELLVGGDDVSDFAEQNKHIFMDIDKKTAEVLREIFAKYPELAMTEKTIADPFIVAHAKARGLTVVTSEKKSATTSPTKPKVPNLCEQFGVKCINLAELLAELKMVFK
jgi:hypothetical protein